MENLIFSLNAIAPIFVLVVLGGILKKMKFAENSFFSVCDKLGFKVCLPCLLFMDIVDASFADIDPKLLLFCGVFVTAIFLLSFLIVPAFLKENKDRGAFIQGICRSNAAILGVTVAENLFGQAGSATIAAVLPVVIALYNIYSITILSIYAPQEKKLSGKEFLNNIVKNIVKNPLILSVLAAVLWNVSGITLPVFAARSLNYLANMCVPLALLSLGAGFSLKAFHAGALKAVCASCIKTMLFPLAAVIAACAVGITQVGLGVIFVIFGGPTAVSSYVMAKQMDSNHALAGDIVLLSTLMSAFTMFVGVFILRSLGLI